MQARQRSVEQLSRRFTPMLAVQSGRKCSKCSPDERYAGINANESPGCLRSSGLRLLRTIHLTHVRNRL